MAKTHGITFKCGVYTFFLVGIILGETDNPKPLTRAVVCVQDRGPRIQLTYSGHELLDTRLKLSRLSYLQALR